MFDVFLRRVVERQSVFALLVHHGNVVRRFFRVLGQLLHSYYQLGCQAGTPLEVRLSARANLVLTNCSPKLGQAIQNFRQVFVRKPSKAVVAQNRRFDVSRLAQALDRLLAATYVGWPRARWSAISQAGSGRGARSDSETGIEEANRGCEQIRGTTAGLSTVRNGTEHVPERCRRVAPKSSGSGGVISLLDPKTGKTSDVMDLHLRDAIRLALGPLPL